MKHITKLLLLLTLACALLLSSCGVSEKTFTKDGMSITLTNRYVESDQDGYTAAYATTDTAVLALKETFISLSAVSIDQDSTLADYANLVINNNSLTDVTVQTKDSLTYFEYESTVDGTTYHYLAAVYKASDAFWLIQFSAEKGDFADKEADFITYAKSVTFA